jgi:hypothetical protein
MKILILISLFSVSLFAQSKADLNRMLGQLKAQGVFTEEQIEAAREQLQKMDQEDMDKLIEAGKAQMNDPEVQEKLKELQK